MKTGSPTVPASRQKSVIGRKRLEVKSGKKSLFSCKVHDFHSDPNAPKESQQHGMDVHNARMHNTKPKHLRASRNKKAGTALAVVGTRSLHERTRPPKEFFDLKREMVQNAAKTEGPASDAWLESAAGLHSLLKRYTK